MGKVLDFSLPSHTGDNRPQLAVLPRPAVAPRTSARRPLRELTAYEWVKARADQAKAATAKAAREAVDSDTGVPLWALAAYRRRWMKDDGTLKEKPSPLDVLTREPGVFAVHRSYSQERAALDDLAALAVAWVDTGARVEQTWFEAEALREEFYFLSHFENSTVDPKQKHSRAHRFAVEHAGWIKSLPALDRIAADGTKMPPSSRLDIFHALPFVAYRLKCSVGRARGLVYSGEKVCELRAQLGYDELVVVGRENAQLAGTLAA